MEQNQHQQPTGKWSDLVERELSRGTGTRCDKFADGQQNATASPQNSQLQKSRISHLDRSSAENLLLWNSPRPDC